MTIRDNTATVWNAMTVDVEEHFQVSAFAGSIDRGDWGSLPSRVVDNTLRLLDLFEETEIQATFFVLGWVAERHPDLLKRIASHGHEMASHGHSHRLIYTQTPEEFRDDLVRSKQLIEDATGRTVSGHRAASFSIGSKNLWALDVIAELGFSYDSSVFPVSHDLYGMPGAPRGIYRVRTHNGTSLVEVPPSTLAINGWALPVGGGGYLRLYPTSFTRWAIRRLNRVEQRPAVVYVHPWEVDPEQPRVKHAPWKSKARHYVNLSTTMKKLGILIKHGRYTTMQRIIDMSGELETVSFD